MRPRARVRRVRVLDRCLGACVSLAESRALNLSPTQLWVVRSSLSVNKQGYRAPFRSSEHGDMLSPHQWRGVVTHLHINSSVIAIRTHYLDD